MFHLSELDVRTHEQNRRDDHANRYGWMRSPVRRTSRTTALASVLTTLHVRIASHSSVRETAELRAVDVPASGSGVRSLA